MVEGVAVEVMGWGGGRGSGRGRGSLVRRWNWAAGREGLERAGAGEGLGWRWGAWAGELGPGQLEDGGENRQIEKLNKKGRIHDLTLHIE